MSAPPRQHSDKRRQEGTIGRSERRTNLLPSEHYQLMPQHEQFEVFWELAAWATDKQPQQSQEREIGEGQEHPPMLPGSTIDTAGELDPRF